MRGYLKDVPILRTKSEPFNPNSSQQIATLLTSLGWQPHVMTEAGKPSTKAAVLMTLPYPEARVISDSKIIAKRLTMLSAGPKSWMNMADDDGRLHTEYNCLGAVTGRASHSPNIAQVPSVKTVTDADGIEHKVLGLEGGYGAECRALFGPPPGWIMVGADMAGLELRCLAHYLFPFDSGDYATIVCTGDVHTVNQQASGVSSRAIAKRLIYCVLYGGGDYKVGTVAEPDEEDEYVVTGIGHQVKQDLISNIAGFRQLFAWVSSVQRRHPARAGRSGIVCKEEHTRLNTPLQAAGAILCKRWILLIEAELERRGLVHSLNGDYVLLIWCHDEVQYGARTPRSPPSSAKSASSRPA